MKTNCIIALALLGFSTLNSQLSTLSAQGTAFTYQGRLNDGANPANGSYDLRFILYNADVGGSQRGPVLTNAATAVNNGLFTVALDFGAVFPGADRWLEIGVRTNGGATFATLNPRQPLTPTPYAIFAANVALTNGTVDTAQLAGGAVTSAKVADGTLLPADLNLGNFDKAFWKVGGNAGTSDDFIGTTDDNTFNIRVNNVRVMRYRLVTDVFYTNSPNVIGGAPINSASTTIVGATIAGGGADSAYAFPTPNQVTADFGTVGGGWDNTVSGFGGTVPGGHQNTAAGSVSFAAGEFAFANHDYSLVWSDGSTATSSSVAKSVTMRASGGFRFFTGNSPVGARLAADDTSWSSISDRNEKKNFQAVNGEMVLEKLAAMPVQSWNYKWESNTNTPHLGPMAQDFKAAFYPGRDDKSISTLEFDGVELAAIQGLNQKLTEELKRRDAENAELKSRLSALEQLVAKLNRKAN